MTANLHQIKTKLQGGTRREVYDGRVHVVVPCVAVVEGVLNEDLVLMSEIEKSIIAWNGRPVPVGHPQVNGEFVTANLPDVHARSIGNIFNAHVDANKLRMELWLDPDRASRLGYAKLVEDLESGLVHEVSVGYFSTDAEAPGVYNGKPYRKVPQNILPDHLAILPNEEGACSVADGCGTRVYQKKGLTMKVNEAMDTLRRALGIETKAASGCECQENHMDAAALTAKVQQLVTTKAVTPDQFALLQSMEQGDLETMATVIGALMGAYKPEGKEANEGEEPEVNNDNEEEAATMSAKQKAAAPAALDEAAIDKIVAKRVDAQVTAHLARTEVVNKLRGYSANKLTEDQMAAMPLEHLKAVEEMIRPADYSGQGGFTAHAQAQTNVQPLLPRSMQPVKKDA